MVVEIMLALLRRQLVCPPPFRKDERQKEDEGIASARGSCVSLSWLRISFVLEGTREELNRIFPGSIR
jgi:hypothetical protein